MLPNCNKLPSVCELVPVGACDCCIVAGCTADAGSGDVAVAVTAVAVCCCGAAVGCAVAVTAVAACCCGAAVGCAVAVVGTVAFAAFAAFAFSKSDFNFAAFDWFFFRAALVCWEPAALRFNSASLRACWFCCIFFHRSVRFSTAVFALVSPLGIAVAVGVLLACGFVFGCCASTDTATATNDSAPTRSRNKFFMASCIGQSTAHWQAYSAARALAKAGISTINYLSRRRVTPKPRA